MLRSRNPCLPLFLGVAIRQSFHYKSFSRHDSAQSLKCARPWLAQTFPWEFERCPKCGKGNRCGSALSAGTFPFVHPPSPQTGTMADERSYIMIKVRCLGLRSCTSCTHGAFF